MNVFENRFAGKVAFITGGASGIGKAIAKRFIAEGGKVAIVDYDVEATQKAIADLGVDSAFGIKADTSKKSEIDAAANAAMDHFGRIDSLFTCAAVTYRCPLVDLEEDPFKHTVDVNVTGVIFTVKAVAKKMIEKGIKGSIVTFASMDAFICSPTNPTYATTKGAIVSMTRTLAVSLIPYGIRVNCLAPGFTDTPFVAATMADPEKLAIFTGNIPIKRIARPEEQAAPALFLASDDASYIVGSTLISDGGSVVTH